MAENTIFFSYSRDNSDFVLDLAKTLREAGATIWLDQLDIPPGARWDRSIEKALENSNTLLVILSKSAVDSNNVMDEVSYALEESRLVVPVLLEDCDIPFRLRRLQYADFTGDHETGIKTLIKALNLEQKVAEKLVDRAKPKPPEPSADPVMAPLTEPKPVEEKPKVQPAKVAPTVQPPKKKSKVPIFIGIAVALLLAIFVLPDLLSDDDNDDEGKNGSFTEEAVIVPAVMESSNSDEPEIEEPTAEELAWEEAKIKNSVNGYIDYFNEHHNAITSERFIEMEDAMGNLFPYSGYVQYSESNGNSFFDKVFYTEASSIPMVGDVVQIVTDRNIKAGPYGSEGFYTTLKVMRSGERALVQEVLTSGSAYWVRIGFQE